MGDRGPRSSASSAPGVIDMETPHLGQIAAEAAEPRGKSMRPFCTSPGSSNGPPRMCRQLRPGSPRCECSACGEGFNSVRAFDRHQRTTLGGGVGCLNVREMMAKGMVWRDGWWYTTGEVWKGPTDPSFTPP